MRVSDKYEYQVEDFAGVLKDHGCEIIIEDKEYRGISLKNMLSRELFFIGEAQGEDGCIIAFSREEVMEDKAYLIPMESKSGNGDMWWRLVFPEDVHRRRWCQKVKKITILEDIF